MLLVKEGKIMIYNLLIHEMVKECCKRYDDICFVLEGNALYGDVIHSMSKDAMCIPVCDRMIYGKVTPSFGSKKFIINRIKANSFMHYGERYNSENIISDILSLQKLSEVKDKTIILIQWNFSLDDFWRLFIQAYIEKYKLAETVIILNFNNSDYTIKTDFQNVEIKGSYEAFCDVVCKRKEISLESFKINDETIEFFMDINSTKGKVIRYIRENLIDEEKLNLSYFNYLKDRKVKKFGLTDFDFYKLVYDEMIKRGEEKLAKKFAKTWR